MEVEINIQERIEKLEENYQRTLQENTELKGEIQRLQAKLLDRVEGKVEPTTEEVEKELTLEDINKMIMEDKR